MADEIKAIVALKKGEGRTLRAGGLWVYDNEIESITGTVENGELVLVKDCNGYPMGIGFINRNSKITIRLLTRNKDAVIDREFFRKRVKDAWEYRKKTVDTSSCRVIFGEADYVPGMVIDKFEDILVVQSLALGIDRYKMLILELLKEEMAADGIIIRGIYERRIELQKEQEIIARRAPFLGKWLWILFWLVVPSEISGIMTMDKVVEAFPLLRVPGLVLGITCSLVYSLILLRISSEHESYRLAGLFGIGSTLLEVFMLILGSTGGLVFLISVIKIVIGLFMTYHEYKAHGESVYPVDAELSECWEKLWKWKIYSIAGLAGSVFLTIISRFLGVVLLFASIIFVLVISVFKLIYLYQTAQAFRERARQ